MNEKWFSLEIAEIEYILKTNAACGLNRKAARSRLRRDGKNNFFFFKRVGTRECVRALFSDPMLLLTILMTVVSALFAEYMTAALCGASAVMNIVISVFVYIKSHRITESCADFAQPKIKVIRDGKLFLTDARGLVRGDAIMLAEGDILPCDVRLISSSGLRVLAYTGRNSDGTEIILEKDANSRCLNEEAFATEHTNCVNAGAVVLSGNARAIVTEIGEFTYIGALDGGIRLDTRSDRPASVRKFDKFSRIYSFAVLLLVLPLTVIGLFTYGIDNLMQTFMTVLALLISSVNIIIRVIGTAVTANGILEAAKTTGKCPSIFRNADVIEDCASLDYCFLLDDGTLTDGKMRVTEAFFDGDSFAGGELFEKNCYRIAENLSIIECALQSYAANGTGVYRDYAEAIQYFAERVGVDKRAFDITLKIISSRISDGIESAKVLQNGKLVTYISSTDISVIESCNYIRKSDGIAPLTATDKIAVGNTLNSMSARGIIPKIAITIPSEPGMVIFEGALGFSKFVPESDALGKLEIAGITPILFFDEENYCNIEVAKAAKIVESESQIALHSKFTLAGADITTGFGNYSVYLGFSDKEIEELSDMLQKDGSKIIACALSGKMLAQFMAADVSAAFDNASYKTGAVNVEMLEQYRDSGREDSLESSQSMRCAADLMIRRKTMKGGGADCIVNAVRTARNISENLRNVFIYMISAQVLRLAVMLPGIFTGVLLLTASELLFSGIVFDLMAALAYSTYFADSDVMKEKYSLLKKENLFESIKYNMLSVGVSGIVLSVAAVVFSFVTKQTVSFAVYLSTAITQLMMFIFGRGRGLRVKSFNTASVFVTVIGTVLSVISALISGLPQASLSLALVPIAPIIYTIFKLAGGCGKRK